MNTVRIPTRYKKQLSRLNTLDRLWIFESLFNLASGENVVQPDTMADFTGQSGRLSDYSPTPNQLPAGEEKRDEEKISKIIDAHRVKYGLKQAKS